MDKPEYDGLLSRWSQRKRAAETEDPVAESKPAEDTADPDLAAELADLPEAEVLKRLGLPDPDSLKMGDDFKPFLQSAVPGYLRKRALRTLWASNPVLANVDGLVEYGEDFTDAAMVPEVLNTVYQVGKGMLREVLKPEDEDGDSPAEAEMLAETEPDPETELDRDDLPEDAEIEVSDNENAPQTPVYEGPEHSAPITPRPRRMRFET